MARYKNVNGVTVAMTPEEEAKRDQEEQEWAASAAERAKEAAIRDAAESNFNNMSNAELLGLLASYLEVQTAKAAVVAGAAIGDLNLPLLDAWAAVYTNKTRLQLATIIENRISTKLTAVVTKLAEKAKG